MSELISCSVCKQCNTKGKPSVTRHSKYCYEHRLGIKHSSFTFFTNIKDKIFNMRYDAKENKLKTQKGFRPSWWYR